MNRIDPDRAFGSPPQVFTKRLIETLRTVLADGNPAKNDENKTRTVIILISGGLLVCAAAYAAVSLMK